MAYHTKQLQNHPTLLKTIQSSIRAFLPINALAFLISYLPKTLPTEQKNVIEHHLNQLYQSPSLITKTLSLTHYEQAKEALHHIITHSIPGLSNKDPFFEAAIQALQPNINTNSPVQEFIDTLSDIDTEIQTGSQKLYILTQLEHLTTHADCRWLFLHYLKRHQPTWESPLIQNLIQGWSKGNSLLDTIIQLSHTPQEQSLIDQYIANITHHAFKTIATSTSITEPFLLDQLNQLSFLICYSKTVPSDLITIIRKKIATISPPSNQIISAIISLPNTHKHIRTSLLQSLLEQHNDTLTLRVFKQSDGTSLFLSLWSHLISSCTPEALQTSLLVPGSEYDVYLIVYLKPLMATSSPHLLSFFEIQETPLQNYMVQLLNRLIDAIDADTPPFPDLKHSFSTPSPHPVISLIYLALDEDPSNKEGSSFLVTLALCIQQRIHQQKPISWLYNVIIDLGRLKLHTAAKDSSTYFFKYFLDQHIDLNHLYKELMDKGYLDSQGLITSKWNPGDPRELSNMSSILSSKRDQEALLEELRMSLYQKYYQRKKFLTLLLTYCPDLFFNRQTVKQRLVSNKKMMIMPEGAQDTPTLINYFTKPTPIPSGYQRLCDDIISLMATTSTGQDQLNWGLKTCSINTLQTLLTTTHYNLKTREILIQTLLKDSHTVHQTNRYKQWRFHLVSTLFQRLQSKAEQQPLSNAEHLSLQETCISFFITNPELIKSILNVNKMTFKKTLQLDINRLYDAKTWFLTLIKQHPIPSLVSDKDLCHQLLKLLDTGFTLLEIITTASIFNTDYPGLYEGLCQTLLNQTKIRTQLKDDFIYYLISLIKPGTQIGRIPESFWDTLIQGKEIQYYLQEQAILDIFGRLLPTHSDQLRSTLITQTEFLKKTEQSKNKNPFSQKPKQFWEPIIEKLSTYIDIQPLYPASFQVACHKLACQGLLHSDWETKFNDLATIETHVEQFDIKALLSPHYQPLCYALFTGHSYTINTLRLKAYTATRQIPVTVNDLIKKGYKKNLASNYHIKLKTNGYLNTHNQLTDKLNDSYINITGIKHSHQAPLKKVLVEIRTQKQLVLEKCFSIQHDFYVLLYGDKTAWEQALCRLYHKKSDAHWLLVQTVLSYDSAQYAYKTTLRLAFEKHQPLSSFSFTKEGLERYASELKDTLSNTQTEVQTLFDDYNSQESLITIDPKQLTSLLDALTPIAQKRANLEIPSDNPF